MVGKNQKDEHNGSLPASFQGLLNLFHLHYAQIKWEGLRCSYHIICSTDSLVVHTGHGDVGHLCHKSQGENRVKTVLNFNILQHSNSMEREGLGVRLGHSTICYVKMFCTTLGPYFGMPIQVLES